MGRWNLTNVEVVEEARSDVLADEERVREVVGNGAHLVHALEVRLQPVELILGDSPARLYQFSYGTCYAQTGPFAAR